MTTKCSFCGEEAAIRIEYARLNLCKKHYIEFIERKVLRSIKRYNLFKPGDHVLVAVSGGKDSSTALALLAKIAKEMNLDITALHINLGINAYSEECVDKVKKLVEEHNVKLYVISLKDLLGLGIPEIARKARRPPCSVCGIIKRYLINAFAIEIGADVVVTGHNLDDMMAYAFKEFIGQNLEAIRKLSPKTETIKNLVVGRARILYDVYEDEVLRYALYTGLPFVSSKCPFALRESLELDLKKLINELEERYPSTKIGFIRRLAKNIEKYPETRNEYKKCTICGLVSSGNECSFCKLTRRVFGEPKGPYVRRKIREIIDRD
ncbi:adenine nucleotide alpha hydrolase family protein [Desulfurococcaceae archaeon MEX13E-LK6-19]|nr:adenine nucleotide alpha hydrolase family protein [Desulfurococcaceae archaeon MEX13E-LK6-19]